MKARHLKILRGLLARPAAPFHEDAVAGQVLPWARRRPYRG